MDKLPSRHAISEVMSWISLMESVIQKDEEDIKNAIGYKAIHEYLQKYKVLNTFCFHVGRVHEKLKRSNSEDWILGCIYSVHVTR